MSRFSIHEPFQKNSYGNLRLPKLKGHVKLTLHNCRTGKNEVIEGENIVTNAVADILANNYLSCVNAGSMMPLWSKWFGGVLAYTDLHPTVGGVLDPDDYFPQDDVTNKLIAHAGDTAPQDFSDDTRRGSPNTVLRVITENSVKQGWEWGTTQGNGIISALSLCHADVGNAGLGSDSNAFAALNPFADIKSASLEATVGDLTQADNICTMYDDSHGLFFHIGDEDNTAWRNYQTDELTVIIRKLPYFKTGLLETNHADTGYERSFTVTLSFDLFTNPCYWFDYENKKLWIFSNVTGAFTFSDTTIKYAVIDCENETIDSEGTIVSDDDDLMSIPFCRNSTAQEIYNPNIVRDGNYFYFPTSSGPNPGNNVIPVAPNLTGYKRININSQSDQEFIPFTETHQKYDFSTKCGGLLLTNGQVVNGAAGYTCSQAVTSEASVRAISQPNKISTYATPLYLSGNRFILANKLVNTTKFNLNSSVEKNASKSMTIEYTLTEVGDES